MLDKFATVLVIAFVICGIGAIISFTLELLADDKGRWE